VSNDDLSAWKAHREALRQQRSTRRHQLAAERAARLARTPEGTPPTRRADLTLRCCGRKPLLYKRDGILVCIRCGTWYDATTGERRS
jgi:hypothetical protein